VSLLVHLQQLLLQIDAEVFGKLLAMDSNHNLSAARQK
jgi:hypothetical protein